MPRLGGEPVVAFAGSPLTRTKRLMSRTVINVSDEFNSRPRKYPRVRENAEVSIFQHGRISNSAKSISRVETSVLK